MIDYLTVNIDLINMDRWPDPDTERMTERAVQPAAEDGRIGTQEAARRLGVKPETLYAYVSRGQLHSRRADGGRGSTFDPAEVAALARRGRPAPAESAAGSSGAVSGGMSGGVGNG